MQQFQTLAPQFLQPPGLRQSEEVPDYEATLTKKDFFPKIFLIPSEVRLDKQKGLVVIKRTEEHPDKFEEEDVLDIMIDQEDAFSQRPSSIVRQSSHSNPAGHGLLSLFKKSSRRKIKLAICVCVYSQSKSMLKSTIKGIQESYKHFYQKAGIMSHEIVLVVVFDGIEKVNNSKDQTQNMISYFNEFDLKNGFRHKPYGKSVEEYFKEFGQSLENYDDISIFTQKQLTDLKSKLFETQHKEYTRIKTLQEEIQVLKKNKDIRIDQLPIDVLKKYQELCLNYCVENNVACAESREEIQEYLSTKKEVRFKLIIESIRQTELLCYRYLESRQDKAILYPVRMESADFEQPRKQQAKKESAQSIPQPKPEEKDKDFQYMFFCVKHKNGGKLSSHLLFFEGFCKIFDPEFCILLDVGLKPKEDALYRMWAYMEKNPKCGGVCGYMGLKIQNPADDLGYRADGFDSSELDWLTRFADFFVNIQRAQQFEYHYAHMLDKPFEACFNYIHVLPGAFSGYRWKALQSIRYQQKGSKEKKPEEKQATTEVRQIYTGATDQNFEGKLLNQHPEENTLMKKYLKTAMSDKLDLSLEESNMYLAEDRIMCLGIHSLGYDLAYLPDAESSVDPVTSLTRMMGQRRRWINGSWFAFEYVFRNRSRRTSCLFLFQLLYYWLVQRLTFITVSLFYITMVMTVGSACKQYVTPAVERFFHTKQTWELSTYTFLIFDAKSVANSLPDVINYIFISTIGAVFFLSLSLNQNNKRFSRVYYFTSSLMGLYGVFIFALMIYNTINIFRDILNKEMMGDFIIPTIYLKVMILTIIVGHAIPVIWTFSFSKWIEMLVSLPSYIFYVPSYANILLIYAFCRIDDLSWGTKGRDEDTQRKKADQWKKEKFIFVCKFLMINILLSYGVVQVLQLPKVKASVILGLTCLVVFLLLFRLFFAFLYLLKYKCKSLYMRFSSETINQNLKNGQQVLRGLKNIQYRIKEIEKHETRLKKQQQFKELKNSKIFESRTLSSIGAKLRNRITQHIIDNNVIPKKEITAERKRYRSKRKILLKKKLNVIEELSNESEDTRNLEGSQFSDRSDAAKSPVARPALHDRPQHSGTEIKDRIEKLRRGRSQKAL